MFILHTVVMPRIFEGNLPSYWMHGEFLWSSDDLDFYGTLYCMVVKCQVMYIQGCMVHKNVPTPE